MMFPVQLAVLWMFLLVARLLHEAAHVVAIWAVGWAVAWIRVGTGPVMGKFEVAGVKVQVGWLPGLGGVEPWTPWDGTVTKARGMVVSLAGLVVDLVVLLVLVRVGLLTADYDWLAASVEVSPVAVQWLLDSWPVLVLAAVMQASFLVADLVPQRTRSGISSDGLRAWKFATGAMDERIARFRDNHREQVRRYDPGFELEGSWLATATLAEKRIFSEAYTRSNGPDTHEAARQLAELSQSVRQTPGEAARLLDVAACLALREGATDEGFRLAAIGWSRAAVAVVPDVATTRGTLGSLLTLAGEWAEAIPLLEIVAAEGHVESDRVTALAYLAKAQFRAGNLVAARAAMRASLELKPLDERRSRLWMEIVTAAVWEGSAGPDGAGTSGDAGAGSVTC